MSWTILASPEIALGGGGLWAAHGCNRRFGLRPEKDIENVVTGLRPGEKLREELFHEVEPLVETGHSGLRLAAPRTANLELLGRSLGELEEHCAGERGAEVMRLLRHLVPEYHEELAKNRASR
jgi:O-antigen biosynthesis protein WbqV